jgi:hypothetical protein
MKAKIHVYPEIGDSYDVEVNIPENVYNVEEYIDDFVEEYLKFVESYDWRI